jgi:hypothetical protein
MTFAERLRKAMTARGLDTPYALAKAMDYQGSSRVAAWLVEGDENMPGGKNLIQLVRTLRVNGHWLLTGEGDMAATPTEAQAFMADVEDLLERHRAKALHAGTEGSKAAVADLRLGEETQERRPRSGRKKARRADKTQKREAQ